MPQSSTAARSRMGPPPLTDPHEAQPPSSIAAIVQSFSKTTATPQLAGRDDFQQLLAELLGPNDLDGGDALALEEDVVMNYRLIQIVTSAGLTVLLQDDPFGSHEDLVMQASSSLLVIRKAIQRNPKVLFCLPPISNDLKQLDQTMLFLWLLPRLLPLLGHTHSEKLVAPLLETIECIFVATTQIPETWKYTKDLICFCRSCFTSIIGNFQSTTKLTAAMSKSFYIELPGEDFVVQNASVKEQIASYPRLLKFHIRCPAQAGLVAIRIYSLLSRLVQTTNYPGLRLAGDNYVWMLNGLAKFWERLSAWEALHMVTETLETLKLHVVDALSKTLDGLNPTKINTINSGNVVIFTLRCTIKVLNQSTQKLDQAMETTLVSVILTLLRIARSFPLLTQTIIKHLYPPAVAFIKQENVWGTTPHNLQMAILAVIRACSLDVVMIDQTNTLLRSISGGQWIFSDPKLQTKADTLGLCSKSEDVVMVDGDVERPRKRTRLSSVGLTETDTLVDVSTMITHMYQVLGNQEATGLFGLSLVASDGFKKLKENDRFLPVRHLGFLVCALAGTLTKTSTQEDSTCAPYHCSICDSNESPSTNSRTVADPASIHELFSTLDTLVKLGDYFRCTPQTRIWGMMGLRRLLNHTDDANLLNAEATYLGQWCLGTMDTSIRELRIAASRTLSSYVSFSHDENLRKANQLYIIKALRELSETEDSIFQETCIMAWGQMGQVLAAQELEVVLAELVQFLGHSNSFIIGVAYNEIQSLANAHKESPRRLFTPFWRSISYNVVRQLQSRPQVIQLLSELCGLEVAEFLVITQAYTLPYLILHRKSNIVERIALANGNITVKALCVTKSNMTAILAVLLTQDIENKEDMAIRSLQVLTPEFCKVTLDELVRSAPIPLAEELIKMAGDKTEAQKPAKERIFKALRLVATLHNRKPTGAPRKEKKADPLGIFFENNVLGITKQFSDTIHDVMGRSTSIEKIRCLQGITEMVKLVKGCSSTALPQICACLQSAMKYDFLRKYSFNAWAAVMCELPEEDILPLVGQTFAIILQYWEQLPDDTQIKVRDMVFELFDRYPSQLEEHVQNLPSLSPIALMAKQNAKIEEWKEKRTLRRRLLDFVIRCRNENGAVVEQALYELSTFLQNEQSYIHTTAMGEQPDVVVSKLLRSLLDACIQYKDTDSNISRLSAECLGIIGAVDPSKVDSPRASKQLIILHNFEFAEESLNFVTFLLEHRLVKAFLAATDTRLQGFLAYAMQELLRFCEFDSNVVIVRRPQAEPIVQKWKEFSAISRNILTPYLTSKYVLTGNSPAVRAAHYPIYNSEHTYRSWLQEFLFDLLTKVQGNNASAIFAICSRIIKGQDVSIPNFLLPYVTLNVVVSGSDLDREQISKELLTIIECSEAPGHSIQLETLRECSEAVFSLLDYLSKWLKAKNQSNSDIRVQAARDQNRHVGVDEDEVHDIAVTRVEKLLAKIPAEVMGIRSFECKSYPRALFYWEQHIRQARETKSEEDMKPLYERLQHIYAQIDEPDSIEGISAHLKIYTIDQQIIEHRNAGRWAAAQSWYEMQLFTKPNDTELQVNLLSCLRESGQYDNLLLQADFLIKKTTPPSPRIVDIVVEASWLAEKWDYLATFLKTNLEHTGSSFEIHLGRAFSALRGQDFVTFQNAIQAARQEVIKGLTYSSTSTLDQCHPSMLKLHALSEVETISLESKEGRFQHPRQTEAFMAYLQRRIELLGASARDKEYILAIRRAIFALSNNKEVEHELAITWLATARLARKAGRVQQAFHAILQGSKLGEQSATVEHARLLWHEGQHRKAIQSLQGVIDARVLGNTSTSSTTVPASEMSTTENTRIPQNFALAKANLLLAKWLDTAGHLHPSKMTAQYQKACHTFLRWEQGFYYLGRHYNKLYEAQKSLPPAQQPQVYLDGETAKLVCQNYLRSLPWGTKYIFQTLPRFLTLWLDLGLPVKLVEEHGTTDFRNMTLTEREKQLEILHEGLRSRYVDKIPAYMWYTVLPQILSRITHPHAFVAQILESIIIKVVSTHPQQAIWSLMAVIKSTQKDRSTRGYRILSQLQAVARTNKVLEKKNQLNKSTDMRVLINQAQKLTEQLLSLCNVELPGKPVAVSLRKDLQFNHSVAPCPLVIPIQSVLSATLPTIPDPNVIRVHQSFAHDQPTIQSFADDADVMSSLQKPRKIAIIGSNGHKYYFLCKPKDDLRKDARLMEFASMFNRLLKKDPDAIQRRLHIRTYHVTPLNEECGLIEWLNNVRPLRDILFKQYKKKGIPFQFSEAKVVLDEACSAPGKHTIFVNVLLKQYPPVLHEWFVDHFPDPASWLSSRNAFARTSAVWSMMGNVLGLGDRHGENILLDETNGATAHVDFNCLFDKGLQFDKPEMVPFRLTHNMVDGFGVSGYEGPFRRSCEVVTHILRLNEETLMTVLEAFLYDPAVDMVGKKPKKVSNVNHVFPNTPKDVLDKIRTKIQGLFPGEAVPLSVEGQVQELIRKAVAPENLCRMYIGWMSFF